MLQQECPGFDQLPPLEALSQLENSILLFFNNDRTETPTTDTKSNTKKDRDPQSVRNLRKRLRALRKEWRRRASEPPSETAELRAEFHAVHKIIKRVSRQQNRINQDRRKLKETTKFRADPFKYGKQIFRPKSTVQPEFDKDTATKFFAEAYADKQREHEFEHFEDLPPPPTLSFTVKTSPPSFESFEAVLRSRRNSSAPGPNGISNVIWKRCPTLQRRLFSVITRVWTTCCIPPSWQRATIRLLHKSGPATEPSNFRPIALTNCDGKIFFALVGKAIREHMIRNSFFDLRLQKGFLPGVAGCLEHSSLLTEALRDARSRKRSICISWIDLRNAFGSVRHSLIQFALRHYQFPVHYQRLIHAFYNHLLALVDVPEVFQTQPFHFAIGVFQGCTLSPLLFNLVVQLLLDSLEQKAHSTFAYSISSIDDSSLLTAAYADDLQLVTRLPEENQALLNNTDRFLKWTETMEARPNKCWSVAMKYFDARSSTITDEKAGYHRFDPDLTIAGQPLQYLDDGDFRYLGRPTNVHGSEELARSTITSKLDEWLQLVDNQTLPNTSKLWLYQHFIIPKLSWYLTALDLTLTFVKRLQAKATKYLKKWSGLPRSANTASLFLGKSGRAGLHITSIVTYWKQMQLVRLDILKHSADVRCCRLYDNLLQRQSTWSRKFPAAVEHACATTVVEANPTPASPQNLLTSESESRSMQRHQSDRKRLLTWVSDVDTEQQLAKLRTLEIQGRWLEWTDVMHSDLSWRRLLHGLDDANLRFSLQIITNTAPTPDNLRRWGVTEIDTSCALCGKPCTLRHVLNACSVALFQGRYTWRHNSVLSVLQRHLLKFWDYARQQPEHQQAPFIRFVPEHARAPRLPIIRRSRRPLPYQDALRCAQDWEFLFDLGEGLVFPPEIAATNQRPDIVIFSRSLRQVILIELTVPLEDRVSDAHSRKHDRYLPLLVNCESNGWHATHFPVEVGCRGFVAFSLTRCLKDLGFPTYWAKRVRNECSRVAQRCSYLLYLRRSIREWTRDLLGAN